MFFWAGNKLSKFGEIAFIATWGQPYLGLVEGKHFDQTFLIQEKRSRMKIMLLDQEKDLPVRRITAVLKQALKLYKKGVVTLG
jgi:hypothetical protein